MNSKPIQRGPAQPLVDEEGGQRGNDVKRARGMSPDAGHSPHESGTDQRVEDAKRERGSKRGSKGAT
jgi:hypothetical protein